MRALTDCGDPVDSWVLPRLEDGVGVAEGSCNVDAEVIARPSEWAGHREDAYRP